MQINYNQTLLWKTCVQLTDNQMPLAILRSDWFYFKKMACLHYAAMPFFMRLIGIEPMTYRLGGGCSILLSYKRM